MSAGDYRNALRLGQREYRTCMSQGEYPYLQVLDELLDHEEVQGEVPLGLVNIPMELLVGTRTEGRRSAFARNFMPLMEESSEFASKWIRLCQSHLKEGIRDPIKVCEFMNHFYVIEGNKRVSVLKFFGAVSVFGVVTRIVPKRQDTLENRIYYEFMDFYRLAQRNDVWFSQPGRFRALLSALGMGENPWTDEEKAEFTAAFTLFRRAFAAQGGEKLPMTPADALLSYVRLYGYSSLREDGEKGIRENLTKSWKEIAAQGHEKPVELFLDPHTAPQKSLLEKLLPGKSAPLKVAFVHMKTAEDSKWVYAHELGRKRLENVMEGRVITTCYEGILPEHAGEGIERAIGDGAKVIFTTTPRLLPATLRTAVEYPSVRFLNCSLNMPHPSLRTYYGRMYEAKFLAGIIAGALTETDRVGYIADYPIYGMTANVNAFALGVRMVNPRAVVFLEWSSQRSIDGIQERFQSQRVDVVSYQDLFSVRKNREDFGLYVVKGDTMDLVATTVWNWGKFYELIIGGILDGSWREPESAGNKEGLLKAINAGGRETAKAIKAAADTLSMNPINAGGREAAKVIKAAADTLGISSTNAGSREPVKAVNYWWGISAGVVDIRYTKNLPLGTKRLVEFLKDSICSGAFRPFSGRLYAQDHLVQEDGELTPEQIVGMDWLVENVQGTIPAATDLTEEAQKLVHLQGVRLEDRVK